MLRALLASALLFGCESGGDPDAVLVADAEAGLRGLSRAVGFTTAFIGSGVVDPAAGDEMIASAIYQRFRAESGSCAQAMATGAVVSVDLGAGCTLASGRFLVGGTATVTVIREANMAVTLRFDLALTVDRGQPLGGRISATTLRGGLAHDADVTLAGILATVPNLDAGIAAGGAALIGDGTLIGRSGTWDLTLAGVHQQFAFCYPDRGAATLMSATRTRMFGFDDSTSQTGAALLDGRTVTLPARMGCPP